MALFVDTSVWSLAFRRDVPSDTPEIAVLRDGLTGGERIVVAGIVLLELLQGFLPARTEQGIQTAFDSLEFAEPTRDDYVAAAAVSNTCRRKGVQLATVDALIAALCIGRGLQLLTTDRDFLHAARHVPLRVWPT